MTTKQKKLHLYLIKICHTLKHNRFDNDEARREYLYSRYNKKSFKELSIDELQDVAKFLGYFIKNKKRVIIKSPQLKDQEDCATTKQIELIENIWFEIAKEKTHIALRKFIFKLTKKKPLYLTFLSITEAQNIINALLVMQKRSKRA